MCWLLYQIILKNVRGKEKKRPHSRNSNAAVHQSFGDAKIEEKTPYHQYGEDHTQNGLPFGLRLKEQPREHSALPILPLLTSVIFRHRVHPRIVTRIHLLIPHVHPLWGVCCYDRLMPYLYYISTKCVFCQLSIHR